MNYQYRFGNLTTFEAINSLYKEGGIPRLYQGFVFALIQGPLSRFGDTASNILLLQAFETLDPTGSVPLFIRTGFGSITAGIWRIVIMPVDTFKTCLQVYGSSGLTVIRQKLSSEGALALYSGALASSAATFVGHYPWFLTYNFLSMNLPTAEEFHGMATSGLDDRLVTLLRSAFIGLCASSISDVTSNSLRVLKTQRQTSDDKNYGEILKEVLEEGGLAGLLTRGLQTRLLVNSLQGMLFSVLFKYFNSDSR